MNERPIPEAAQIDPDSVEMMRLWIAQGALHCSLKVGMYRETMNVPEGKAWGRILADAARHVANALQEGYGVDSDETLEAIRAAFNEQISAPETVVQGEFVVRTDHRRGVARRQYTF